jgi:prohibitin 2
MASRIPKMPNLPIGAIVGGVGATAALGGLGYLGFHSVYSGAWKGKGRGVVAPRTRRPPLTPPTPLPLSLPAVKPGERAIIFNRMSGVKQHVYGEGTHVLLPWFEWPIIFDVRTRPRAIKSQSGTRDLQMVDIGLRVLTRPDPSRLPEIYRKIGADYDDKILPSIVNEVLKQVIAQFNATALLTQREQVSARIKANLQERAKDFHLVLEDVSITDLKFGREFEKAVESKQVAQQDAERARFIVEKALQDKKSIIIKAEGEASAATMIGKAVANNPGFVQLRRIDAAKEIATTIATGANAVYLPSDALLLNIAAALQAGAGARGEDNTRR